ncbi:MAG: tetratricopeptide repeat protein [Chloroflexota bacterium]
MEENQTSEEQRSTGEESVGESVEPADSGQPVSAQVPAPQARKSKRVWLYALVVLIILAVAGAGGFFGIRWAENRSYLDCRTALDAGDLAAAEAACTKALNTKPASWQVHSVQAQALRCSAFYQQDKYTQAINDCDAALAGGADNAAQLHVILGDSYRQQADWANALSAYQAATQADPALAEAHIKSAEIYLAQGDRGKALQEAVKGRDLDDRFGLPYALEAVEAYQASKYERAMRAAQSAIERDQGLAMAYQVRGSLYAWRMQWEEATADLNTASELAGDTPETLAMQVYIALQNGDTDTAEAKGESLKQLAPDSAANLWAQAMLAANRRDYVEGLRWINQAIELQDERPEFYVCRAQNYETTAQQKNALADYDEALRLNKDFIPAIAGRLWLQHQRFEGNKLETEAERLIQLAPEANQGYTILSSIRLRAHQFDKALEACQKAIDLQPEHSAGYLACGNVYLAQYEFEPARAAFESAQQHGPEVLEALAGQAKVLTAQRDFQKAIQILDQALAIDARSMPLLAQKAEVYLQMGDYVKANDVLQEATQIDAEHQATLIVQARLYLAQNKIGQANKAINQAIGIYPGNPVPYLVRARVYLLKDDPDNARQEADEATQYDPQMTEIQVILALVDLAEEEWSSALENAETAIELDAHSAEAFWARGQAYYGKALYGEAVTDLEQALKLNPDLEKAYYDLAWAHRRQGDVEAAIQDLENLLNTVKDASLKKDAQEDLEWLKDIPPLVDGLRTIRDTTNGYAMSYPLPWLQESALMPNDATYLTLTEPEGLANFMIMMTEVSSTPQVQAMIILFELILDKAGFDQLSKEDFQAGKVKGYATMYQYESNEDNKKIVLKSKVYWLWTGHQLATLQYTAPVEIFDNYLAQADLIAASFEFLPVSN